MSMNRGARESMARLPKQRGDIVVTFRRVTSFYETLWRIAETPTVDDLDFELRRSEVIGVLGPTGSGKSTTLRLMLDELSPTFGCVKIFDRSPRSARVRKSLGYLPEENGFFPRPSSGRKPGFFNRLWARLLGRCKHLINGPPIKFVRAEAAASVGTPGESQNKTQRQIKLAWIIHRNPQMVILDEPMTGLDPAGAQEMKDLILALAGQGKTVILSSPALMEVADLCNRVLILHRGRIQASGPPADILRSPDALRVIAPVLPDAIQERLLKVLRESIGNDTVPCGVTFGEWKTWASVETSAQSTVNGEHLISSADRVLMNLTEPLAHAAPMPCSAPQIETINHKKLQALAKPAPGIPSPASSANPDALSGLEKTNDASTGLARITKAFFPPDGGN